MESISASTLKSVKECLFGLQKQANAINDGVVVAVCKELMRHGYASFNDADEVQEALHELLNKVLASDATVDETVMMLICGPQSVANLQATGPKTLYIDKPSTESPKWIFRINMLGEDAVVEHEGEVGSQPIPVQKPAVSPDEVTSPNDDFQTRADKIRDAIMPMVPDAVKTEVSDPYAQALCCAEYFYGYNK